MKRCPEKAVVPRSTGTGFSSFVQRFLLSSGAGAAGVESDAHALKLRDVITLVRAPAGEQSLPEQRPAARVGLIGVICLI
jgi:hypothetical protein